MNISKLSTSTIPIHIQIWYIPKNIKKNKIIYLLIDGDENMGFEFPTFDFPKFIYIQVKFN
jgi:hypothetical protein